jgi:hypothetical protein
MAATWLFVLVFSTLINLGLTAGIQWCASELFHKELPFWPLFVALVIISALAARLRQK